MNQIHHFFNIQKNQILEVVHTAIHSTHSLVEFNSLRGSTPIQSDKSITLYYVLLNSNRDLIKLEEIRIISS
jgi:hypothetical protein